MWWQLLTPIVASIAGAVLFRLVRRTKLPRLDRRSAILTGLAAGASSLVMIGFSGSVLVPMYVTELSAFPWATYEAVRFILPLVLGIVTVLALGFPARSRRSGGAQLTPRSWLSFLSRPWSALVVIVLGIVVAVTAAAGLASERDEAGHFTAYVIELGDGSAETTFYGWHYSVGPMIAVGILLVAAVTAWAGIARPPHPEDLERDIDRRRLRSANVARVASGAMLLHLASVARSLASTASMSLTVGTDSGENFSTGTSFADLAPVLEVGAPLIATIGLGLWIFTALSSFTRPGTLFRESASS